MTGEKLLTATAMAAMVGYDDYSEDWMKYSGDAGKRKTTSTRKTRAKRKAQRQARKQQRRRK